jgi:cellulose synthase (UDP-forming)
VALVESGFASCALVVAGILLVLMVWWKPESPIVRRALVGLSYALNIRYVVWRWDETLPPLDGSLESSVLLAFFLVETSFIWLMLKYQKTYTKTLRRSEQATRQAEWYKARPKVPRVDVFIPTYNENWQVLERTLVGVCGLRHSGVRIFVLDDGRRDWLAARARECGVGYLTRPNNAHFKSGNLNNALRYVMAGDDPPEFIAVFDADFIPHANFLERTLALMADENVGVVQTPQVFYNPDPFQHAFLAQSSWPDEQRHVFDIRMLSSDAHNAALCCGTSFLIRTCALEKIGGFPTESICEDTLTTIKLRGQGYGTVYLAERLSSGLNPEGLGEFFKQRSRWCLGGVQIGQWSFRTATTWNARIGAFESIIRWGYMSFVRLLWLVVSLVFWFTGFSVLHAGTPELVGYIVPLWLLRGAFMWMGRGTQLPIISDAVSLSVSPTAVAATLGAFLPKRKHRFHVTDKGISRKETTVHWRSLGWSCGLLVVILVGVAYRTFWAEKTGWESYIIWAYYSTGYQVLVLATIALAAIERPRRRISERYVVREPVGLSAPCGERAGCLVDLSVDGARVACEERLGMGDMVVLNLAGIGAIPGQVVRKIGRSEFGIRFDATPLREQLIKRIYCSELCVPKTAWSLPSSLAGMARRFFELFRMASRSVGTGRALKPFPDRAAT